MYLLHLHKEKLLATDRKYNHKGGLSFIILNIVIGLIFILAMIFLINIILNPVKAFSQQSKTVNNDIANQQTKIYGITVDDVSKLNTIISSISKHNNRMTTRIVFDEYQPAVNYEDAVNGIDSVSDIMGEVLDSRYVKEYSVNDYTNRFSEYMDLFENKVDIWEIGNEINGEWLGGDDSVIAKMTNAYNIVKKRNKPAALTFYYNYDCWENPENEMFRWINKNVPLNMMQNLDYVFVSYYEDDCNNNQPNWQQVFDSLHAIFPNSKLGIGECGTKFKRYKAEYINRYYRMNITTPNFVGGYFWWYYAEDCVPWNSKKLWQVLENAMMSDSDNVKN